MAAEQKPPRKPSVILQGTQGKSEIKRIKIQKGESLEPSEVPDNRDNGQGEKREEHGS